VSVTGYTHLAAIIGDPVRHSLSPVMHNAAFAATGLDWLFVALPVQRGAGAQAMDAIRVLGIEGVSVTMPHKADAAAACDEVRGDAAQLRSVNCVSRGADGTLVGESTDGEGFLRSLREAGHDPSGATALVLGAGGAARAVALALAQAGARVRVAARRVEAAGAAAALAPGIKAVGWHALGETARSCDVIVNATPIGMRAGATAGETAAVSLGQSGTDAFGIEPADLGPGHVVVDLVYHPRRTALLETASAAGASTVEGAGMLVHQGAIAFERWTGTSAPVEVMRSAVVTALATQEGPIRPR
jgi:shikimate dehydrogenase